MCNGNHTFCHRMASPEKWQGNEKLPLEKKEEKIEMKSITSNEETPKTTKASYIHSCTKTDTYMILVIKRTRPVEYSC